jgi:hypothetical protein
MNVLKRRTRMVSFRLSEEEYEGLQHICTTVGARSLSDIARDAVQRLLSNGTEQKIDGDAQLSILHERMDALDHELKRLAALVEQPDTADAKANAATSSR